MKASLWLALGILSASFAWSALGADKPATAGETLFHVQLIWATNSPKPADKQLSEIEPKLGARLKGVFKWKDYYEVCSKPFPVPKDTAPKLKLSDKCEIQAQDLGGSRVEVRLYGEGKLVVKKTQAYVPGEMIILAGDAENDSAWFVVLTPAKH